MRCMRMVDLVGYDVASGCVSTGKHPGEPRHQPPRRAHALFQNQERKVAPAIDPAKVVAAFNTWAFKREQPDAPERLLQVVDCSVRAGEPVPFVLYWGKGPRAEIAAPDVACMDYLAALAARVRSQYPAGAAVTLILTDTHAELNGHDPAAIASYFRDIAEEAARHGFTCCRLSMLVEAAGVVPDVAGPTGDMLRSLTACATKWYRGEGSAEEGALTYYRLNMAEKRAVEIAFPRSVFLTFNGSEFRDLFPAQLPVFYMYSLRRGVGVKPWFMSGDTPAGDARAA